MGWCSYVCVPAVALVLWSEWDELKHLPKELYALVKPRAEDASSIKNAGWVASRDQTPAVKAERTELVDFKWTANTTCSVSPEDIAAFDRDGFLLVRGALDPEALDIMLEEASRICKKQLATRGVCQIEQLRWQVNSFRDFMFYSALGCYAHQFIRTKGVRIATEALFGTQYNKVNPHFFSYGFHTDTPGDFYGRYHGYVSDTPGVSVWFPFHDLDNNTQGGSLNVIRGYPSENDCRFRACGGMVAPSRGKGKEFYDCSPCKGLRPDVRSFPFKKGDVLFFHPDMPHQTQPVMLPGFTRHSFTIRMVDSDATLCSVAMSCGDWMGCCKDIVLKNPQVIHSHCWPQIFPQVLDHEVEAHYSDTPKHLMGDLAWNDKAHTIATAPVCTAEFKKTTS